MNKLADYLRELRGDRSLNDICKGANINRSVLNRLELGDQKDLKVSTLLGLAKALNVDPRKLLLAYEGKDPESIPTPPLDPAIIQVMRAFIKAMPKELVAEVLAQEIKIPEGRQYLIDRI